MNASATTIKRLPREALIVIAVCAWTVLCTLAAAFPQAALSQQPRRLVAGGDPTVDPRAGSGHGWAFLPAVESEGESEPDPAAKGSGYLLHIVPRQSVLRASAGSVRLAMPLTRPPLQIAGWEGTAILLQGPPGDDASSPAERSIATLAATGPLAVGTWDYEPGDHLKLRAALPADTVPRSMVAASILGSSHGPVMVWERVTASSRELEIAVLNDAGAWNVLEPPPGFVSDAAAEAHVLAAHSGVFLAVRAPGDAAFTLWTAEVDLTPPASPKVPRSTLPLPTRWSRAGTAALPEALRAGQVRTIGPAAPCWLWRDSGQTLLAARAGDVITLWRLDPARAIELWRSQPLPRDSGALVIGGLDAVTVLAYDVPQGSGPRPASSVPDAGRLRMIDISHLTGAVIADLSAHTDGFLSRRELQILWLLFILIGVVILTVVLRTDGPQEVQLPEGTALASPVRRVLAGAIDVAVAVALTSLLIGGTPAHWLAPTTSTSSSLVPLLSVFGIGCLLATLGEATIGCSPGKLLVGARVLGLVAASTTAGGEAPTIWRAARPRLQQAFLRNAVRWFMPPMGMMMLLDNNWRHPGDLLARTVVVVRFDPDEPPPRSEDDGEDL